MVPRTRTGLSWAPAGACAREKKSAITQLANKMRCNIGFLQLRSTTPRPVPDAAAPNTQKRPGETARRQRACSLAQTLCISHLSAVGAGRRRRRRAIAGTAGGERRPRGARIRPVGTSERARAKGQAWSGDGLGNSPGRQFDAAANTTTCKRQIDLAAQFIGEQIADYADAVSLTSWRGNPWAADLVPLNFQRRFLPTGTGQPPVHRYCAIGLRQCSVLGGLGGE